MATVKQYVTALSNRQQIIAMKYGTDLTRTSKGTRVAIKSVLVLLAIVIKTLVDKGVVTDAELTATLDAARDDAYDDEPVDPPA